LTIEAHALAFQAVLDRADALLGAARNVPVWLIPEYEFALELPSACFAGLSIMTSMTNEQRIAAVEAARLPHKNYTESGMAALFARAGVSLVSIQRYTPAQCTDPCTQMMNTPKSRFRMTLHLNAPTTEGHDAVPCIIAHYLPDTIEIRTVFE
jgi:uncharacterized protein YmfQ (DUF2313 family)